MSGTETPPPNFQRRLEEAYKSLRGVIDKELDEFPVRQEESSLEASPSIAAPEQIVVQKGRLRRMFNYISSHKQEIVFGGLAGWGGKEIIKQSLTVLSGPQGMVAAAVLGAGAGAARAAVREFCAQRSASKEWQAQITKSEADVTEADRIRRQELEKALEDRGKQFAIAIGKGALAGAAGAFVFSGVMEVVPNELKENALNMVKGAGRWGLEQVLEKAGSFSREVSNATPTLTALIGAEQTQTVMSPVDQLTTPTSTVTPVPTETPVPASTATMEPTATATSTATVTAQSTIPTPVAGLSLPSVPNPIVPEEVMGSLDNYFVSSNPILVEEGESFWSSFKLPDEAFLGGTPWVNPENGVTQTDIIKDMISQFASANGHPLEQVYPGNINLNELELTPEQLEIIKAAMKTSDSDDYIKNVWLRFRGVLQSSQK